MVLRGREHFSGVARQPRGPIISASIKSRRSAMTMIVMNIAISGMVVIYDGRILVTSIVLSVPVPGNFFTMSTILISILTVEVFRAET
jgi:hypothetical protein